MVNCEEGEKRSPTASPFRHVLPSGDVADKPNIDGKLNGHAFPFKEIHYGVAPLI